MKGIPTVLITVSPEVSAQMRPPRAIYPKGFKVGNSLGRPGMKELQKRVLKDALQLLSEKLVQARSSRESIRNTVNSMSRRA
jgi:D-proline reductase (dithiol) PrdB